MVCLEIKNCIAMGSYGRMFKLCYRQDGKDAKKMGGTVRRRKKDKNWRATLENSWRRQNKWCGCSRTGQKAKHESIQFISNPESVLM
jgi:hypothetical protein